jgi:DNA (cytosine-5)-methyltransferase 1
LGGLLLGWRTVCAVEIDAYCRSVLLARQRDGLLEPFPIWDDVRTFDGKPWRGHVDVISGGFPCQDISSAVRGAGIDGERSGLWSEFSRIIREVGPRHVLVENSPMLIHRGIERVLGDLAAMGFAAQWGVLGACAAGAPHTRERVWIVADASAPRRSSRGTHRMGARSQRLARPSAASGAWLEGSPSQFGVADGVAHRVDRLGAIGNGQVPAVVRLAWQTLNPTTPATAGSTPRE